MGNLHAFLSKWYWKILVKIYKVLPDSLWLKIVYKAKFRRKLNLKDPQTFTEKLQWLKLYDRNQLYTSLVDKYEVKKWIDKKLGPEFVIPNYGVWTCVDEIDFEKLPNQFVLKCTHDSGGIVICKDKSRFDLKTAKEKLDDALKKDFWQWSREWPYKNVKPRIIAEEYIEDDSGALLDYKFFCFNGKVKCFKIDFDRYTNHKANYYSPNGELLRLGERKCPPDFERKAFFPSNLVQMLSYAEMLSENLPFVRVDFYNVRGKILFGEMTFFPDGGFGVFEPSEWDRILGDWLVLPINKRK